MLSSYLRDEQCSVVTEGMMAVSGSCARHSQKLQKGSTPFKISMLNLLIVITISSRVCQAGAVLSHIIHCRPK
jgi:hypothetical protein